MRKISRTLPAITFGARAPAQGPWPANTTLLLRRNELWPSAAFCTAPARCTWVCSPQPDLSRARRYFQAEPDYGNDLSFRKEYQMLQVHSLFNLLSLMSQSH